MDQPEDNFITSFLSLMGMGLIEKFWVEGDGPYALPPFGSNFDYAKIIALPDEDFAKMYLELMVEYRDKDGWWSGDRIPKCRECRRKISGPEQMRRYEGSSFHPNCFRKFHKRESREGGLMAHEHEIMKTYWERVARLKLG